MPDEDPDTLPLIPIREETGLPPPPESGVREVAPLSRGPTEACSRPWTQGRS